MTRELYLLCLLAGVISASMVLMTTKSMKVWTSEQTLFVMFGVSSFLIFVHLVITGDLPSFHKPTGSLLALGYACIACTVGNLIVLYMWNKARIIGSNTAYPYALHTGLAAALTFLGSAALLQGDFSVKRAGGILLVALGAMLLK